ncbi:hypothetical protein DI487_15405 [Flavobacterium sediminis]|uniref:Uncharacterized protein n=1 Tax=Flavobacterium sediminis TaxID=2201181 RepID=A0A2U8QY01_9FLAO|nr:hypothetical protein [Flavobacterium sediminis]AWM15100.1 hypothetical protein DI487_15405 [Flavobacterium sediminis]
MDWKIKLDNPYGGHWLDTVNSRLLVKTVYWKNVAEYDVTSGKLISYIKNDSLQKLIESKMKDEKLLESHEYHFIEKGIEYTLKCRPSKGNEVGEYTIEIEKYYR